ncbi:amidase family protein [Burkholderia multivorans]|uniref:amidase family protein n=1 Tax=Burkholderia multivorans TaxID=87883 RepID=UPI001C27E03A|nr:amidase family protein [Burkholderia multivorans]MBU9597947.1 amidase [Burkholderia multivorans]MDN8000216.1 amidase family protein [Burkholderia multivorans]WVN01607.1 amidase family protein [Burkholderia multivorans]
MGDHICDLTAQELHALYKTGGASPVEVMQAVLLRIEQLDPAVNAFCQIAGDALDMARASEKRWQNRQPLGPLDGVPISIKDNVAVSGLATRYGSRATDESPALHDSPCVARLREAGAICFAKTTLPDFAHKIITDSPLTGVTRNPWDTRRTPGGSSGGAAAAVSLGMGPAAIGTDGGGSIRIPAAFTGTFGFKPSFGRVPHAPRGPFGLLSHVGPMTRCVVDAARILTVISRPDSRDWYALPFEASDYELGLNCKPVPGGVRIAYSPSLGLAVTPDTAVHDAVMRTVNTFRDLGATTHQEDPPGIARCNTIHATLWPACCRQLTEGMADDCGKLDPSLQAYSDVGAGISRQALLGALIERGELGATVNVFFERYDLLVCPVYPCVAMPLAELPTRRDLFPHFTAWCNQLGLPAASVYAGTNAAGLPVGVQIVGGRHADALVLWASHILELTWGRAPFAELARMLSSSIADRKEH